MINSEEFHESTKYAIGKSHKKWSESWSTIHYKEYPRFRSVELPKVDKKSISLADAILKRHSSREEMTRKPLTLKQLSKFLFYSAGITRKRKNWNHCFRSWASAGARFPLEIYIVNFNIKGLEKGVYHYNVKQHSLECIYERDVRKQIIECANQSWVHKTGALVLISAVFDRTKIKYGERGYRFVFLDAGHIAQNMYLVSTSMNLGCCAIGGFLDDKINKILDIDGTKESVIYLLGIGTV